MRKGQIRVVSLIAVLLITALVGVVYADTGVPAVPEIQGLTTGTSSNVVGTVTETDSGAWTTTNDPTTMYMATGGTHNFLLSEADVQQIEGAGGSAIPTNPPSGEGLNLFWYETLIVPESLMDQQIVGLSDLTWGDYLTGGAEDGVWNLQELSSNPGIHTGTLDPEQVQYTSGYNDQYSGVSGQQTFTKSDGSLYGKHNCRPEQYQSEYQHSVYCGQIWVVRQEPKISLSMVHHRHKIHRASFSVHLTTPTQESPLLSVISNRPGAPLIQP